MILANTTINNLCNKTNNDDNSMNNFNHNERCIINERKQHKRYNHRQKMHLKSKSTSVSLLLSSSSSSLSTFNCLHKQTHMLFCILFLIPTVIVITTLQSVHAFSSKTSTTTTTAFASYAWSNKFSTNRPRSNLSKLYMGLTKSGGRPILSTEQFQTEVLFKPISASSSNEKEDDNENENTPTTQKNNNNNEKKRPTLVLYSAPWCGPCRLTNPVVKSMKSEFQNLIDVVEVCTDDLPDIAESAGIVSIPTIQLYYNGVVLDTIVGCVAKNVLATAVNKVLEDLGLVSEDGDVVVDDDEEGGDDDVNEVDTDEEDESVQSKEKEGTR